MGIGESLTLHVTNLPDYCKRADNQNKRNQKLNYNQYFPYPVATFAMQQFSPHNLRRTYRNHQPRGVKPYDKRSDNNNSDYNSPKSG